MKTDLFDYDLPRDFIAQHPADRRDASKLLVLHRDTGETEHRTFTDLIDYIEAGDALVVNDTRVVRARVFGTRSTGGAVEMLLIRPGRGTSEQASVDGVPSVDADASGDAVAPGAAVWEVMLNCRGRLQDGERIEFDEQLSATLLGRNEEGVSLVAVRCEGDLNAVLDRIGRAPLPPYIKRARLADPFAAEDAERYQTVYARSPGAVAAPTAGLHFSPALLERIKAKGCRVASVTLHVGPGTFKPVQVEEVEDHRVDGEYYVLSPETAEVVNGARRVIAVGTTTCRVLETLAVAGEGRVRAGEGWTELFIRPPHAFGSVDALITNFHLPRSSLLLLVSAFASREQVMAAYEEAKENAYRFYSYGDAMLIL